MSYQLRLACIFLSLLLVVVNGISQEPNISALRTMLLNGDVEIRMKAAEGLGRVGGRAAISSLRMGLSFDNNATVRMSAAKALGSVGGKSAMTALSAGFNDKDPMVRKIVVESLKDAGTVLSIPYLKRAFSDKDESVRMHGVLMLKIIGHRSGVPLLGSVALEDKSSSVRAAAATYMGRVGVKDQRAVGVLAEVLEVDPNPTVRMRAVESLGFLQLEQAIPVIERALADQNLGVRIRATEVLGYALAREFE